jgi:tetratricopeptide (TPR) repeat protein
LRSAASAALAAALLLAGVCGCTPRGEVLRAELESGQRPGRYIPLKFVRQERNRCGSAALSEVLTHWGASRASEQELAREVFSESLKGTINADLTAAVRRRGLVARDGRSSETELRAALTDGYPVVALITISPHVLGKKHFMALKGVDNQRGYLMADDGRREDAVLKPRTFRRDWRCCKYWALYCWPPERSPEWARASEELRAGVILERAGRAAAAAAAYRRALKKDAGMWEAEFNLGNLALAAGRTAESIAAYRRAVAVRADEPDVLNNLAYALLASGRGLEEAERLARRATELSGEGTAGRVRARHTLGVVLSARGKQEKARRALGDAVSEAEKLGRKDLADAARADLEKLGK